MNDIFVRQLVPDDLDPELLRIVTPIARRWEAAALRVAAHHADPRKFKLPTGKGTPEAILAQRFDVIAKQRPDRAKASAIRAVDQLSLPKTQNKLATAIKAGAGGVLDFSQNVSVENMMAPAKAPSKAALLRSLDRQYVQLGIRRTTSDAIFREQNVSLDLIRVVCIDETNGFLGSEAGDDEIAMSGMTLDQSATVAEINPFTVSNSFDDGERVDYAPPKRLFTHTIGGGTSYPKHYFSTLLMFEKDQGDMDETMKALVQKFADEIAASVAGSLGAAIGTLLAGPLGTAAGALIGWLVGWLMGKLVARLIAIWEDDPFIPRTLELVIPSSTSQLHEPSKVFHFTGPGEYAVRYRWAVT